MHLCSGLLWSKLVLLHLVCSAALATAKDRPQKCPTGLTITGVDEWIQGETTLDAGSLTMVFFMSQSCHVCHDVAPTLNQLYKKYRRRGLQIIAVHATPKGYKAKTEDVAALKQWIAEEKLEFSVVDTHSKDGEQPTKSDGTPDYIAAGHTAADPDSLYMRLEEANAAKNGAETEEYGVPALYVLKNCDPIVAVSSYQIHDIEAALQEHWDSLLWKDNKRKTKTKSKGDL